MPVTIITGYLGAGKTTLLRRIAQDNRLRLAIVMNEFGDIAIDSRVVSGKNITMAELAGGCVCCSLSGEFGLAVSELLETAKPEWIVVETTGAAEPAALAHDIRENILGIRLDSIVTVVDADTLLRFPSLGQTGREQIELADLIVINKTDLAGKEGVVEIRKALAALNSKAAIVEAERCGLDTRMLFGISRKEPIPGHKPHVTDFGFFDFVSERVMGKERLMRVMGGLPQAVFRAKGFARTDEGGYLVNYVAGRLGLEPHACEKTELVFIGIGAESCRKAVVGALSLAER